MTDQQPHSPTGRFSIRLRIAIGGALLLAGMLAVVLLALFLLRRGRSISYTTLDESSPSRYHASGLVVNLVEGSGSLRISISTISRDAFLAGEAGATWNAALAALPDHLTPLSPIYTIEGRGEGQIVAEIAIPEGAEPLLDLYAWDSAVREWMFVPGVRDRARQVVTFRPEKLPISVMAVQASAETVTAGMVISQGGADLGADYGLALPEGVSVDAGGLLTGTPAATSASTVLPLISNRQGGFTAYSDPNVRTPLVQQLAALGSTHNGLALDFVGASGYTDFVAVLAEQLHARGKRLDVIVPAEALADYDLIGLAAHVDRIWLAAGVHPADYLPGGATESALAEMVGMVERGRIGLLVREVDVDITDGVATPISFDAAAAQFGEVEAVAGYLDPRTSTLFRGSILPLRLTGPVEAMGYDATFGMNYLTYRDGTGSPHYVYFASAQNLSRRLELARRYALGAVAVYGAAHPDAPANLADGLSAFLGQQQIGPPQPLAIVWQVRSTGGAWLGTTEGELLLMQYVWEAAVEPGQYTISAVVRNQNRESARGAVTVNVIEPPAPVPESEP